VGENQLLLAQIQEDLLNDADTADAVNGGIGRYFFRALGSKLTPENVKVRQHKFL